jgi:multiple sugar transport system substrate-binding protein
MSQKTSRRGFLKAAAVFSAGSLLAACAPAQSTSQPGSTEEPASSASGSKDKKKIVFNSYTWSGYEAATRSVLDEWAKANPDVELEQQYVPQDDYWTKIQTMVASGAALDVGIADYGRLVSYAKNGTLLNVQNYVTANNYPLDKAMPTAVSQYRWNTGEFDSGGKGGDMYGLPSDAQSQVMVYNKKMFDEAGVDYPTDDWTWDNVVDTAKKITKADQNKWGIQYINTYILFKGNFVWPAGGAIHTPDFTKSLLDSPETIEAYKWNWDLIYTHKVSPKPGAGGQTNPFMTGQVAMYIEGVWWISDFVNGIKDFEWDVALFPKHPKTGKRTTSVESDGWWIYKTTKEPDTAWDLLSYLASEPSQKKFGDLNYIIPSCYPDTAKLWYSKTPPANRMKVLDNIQQDSEKVDFTYFEFGTITNAVFPVIDKAFADGDDIEKTMVEASKVMNEELDKAWELFKS